MPLTAPVPKHPSDSDMFRESISIDMIKRMHEGRHPYPFRIDFLLLASSDRKPKRFLQRRNRENPTRFRSETAKSKRSNVSEIDSS